MKLGICTRYLRHEATYAAIRLATAARRLGFDVSIYGMNDNIPTVDSYWDSRVVSPGIAEYTQWANQQSHIIWTHIPHIEQFYWTIDKQKKTTILLLWNESCIYDGASDTTEVMSIMASVDKLICPSDACYNTYVNTFSNCWALPWDCGYPLYQHPSRDKIESPNILLPLWDGASRRMEMTVLQLVANTLHEFNNVRFTIPYDRKATHVNAIRRLRELRKCFGDRVHIPHNVAPERRFIYYQQHDLTLYPSQHENIGINLLTSLEMGTPVLAFNAAPVDEIVDDTNGVCVRCYQETHNSTLGRIIPNYEMLQIKLFDLLRDTATLCQKQQATTAKARVRRELFESQCALMLPTAM